MKRFWITEAEYEAIKAKEATIKDKKISRRLQVLMLRHEGKKLAELSKQYPEDLILLVCDGAAWHGSKFLACPSNIRLLPIPPYTPEMNPIEQIWKQLRSMGFRNEVEIVKSITGHKWIIECF